MNQILYLIHKLINKTMIQKLRIISLVLIHLLILAHIYIFGDKIIGSLDFQEFFHAFIKSGIINSGVVLVILAFITTLIFGRFFCGWACHFGAVQELSWFILNKMGITPKTINSSLVTILPLIILLNFYIIPNLIFAINSPWGGISINLGMPEIWAFLPGFIVGTITFIVDGFLIVYFLGRKGFCRFLCPWGAFLKLPSSLAMFKVRNVGGCSQCGDCTTNCPIGIDVNYEINNYGKVSNTNCTSCLICTDGCPTSAIAYKWESPIKENFQIKHYFLNQKMFKLPKIADRFQSLHNKDLLLLPLILAFGYAIDGLYGMGHFLSFGIATICSIFILKNSIKSKFVSLNNFVVGLTFIIFIWHGIIKFSIWRGLNEYANQNYFLAISHLERAIYIYPKSIGRFHLILAEMYIKNDEIEKANKHIIKAQKINPKHSAPKELLIKLNQNK